MKNTTRKILTIAILFTSLSFTAKSQTNVSGGIFINTTWTLANSPYIVVDTVVVFPNVTLTIEPGVVVKFDDHKYIEIRQGTLIANGNSADSITFTSNSLTPTPGIWGADFTGGIWLNAALGATSFNFCILKYATIGIYNGWNIVGIKNSIFINNLSGLSYIYTPIDSCIFKFNVDGIYYSNSCSLNFCNISNNTNGIEGLTSGSMVNCTIDSNQTGLVDVDDTKIYNCTISYNQTGIGTDQGGGGTSVENCIIDSNSTLGIAIYGHGDADSVINCEIKFNGIGLIAATCPNFGNTSIFTQCIIEGNTTGIQVGGCSNIYCNSFCNNTSYDLQNLYSAPFNVANNYWCTSDSATVEAHIYDGYDNTSLGLVSFMPLDTLQCYSVTGIPINEALPASFSIFPNPASDYLIVESPANISKADIKIFNMLGEIEISTIETRQQATVDVSRLATGVYILEASSGNKICREKFIKE